MLRVLAYHRVADPERDALETMPSVVSATPSAFVAQARHLARAYRVLSAAEVLAIVRSRQPFPARAVLLTFDDAYRDFGDTAWPILRGLGLPATLFVPTGFPDATDRAFWWDRLYRAVRRTSARSLQTPVGELDLADPTPRRAGMRRLLAHLKTLPDAAANDIVEDVCGRLGVDGLLPSAVLGWEELRRLAAEGVTMAPHTRGHPALPHLDREGVRSEVLGSRCDLERELGSVLPIFAYPYGAHDGRVVDVLRDEGIELAFTCLDGQNASPPDDPLRLRRTNITPRTSSVVFRFRLLRVGARLDRWRHRRRWTTPAAGGRTG